MLLGDERYWFTAGKKRKSTCQRGLHRTCPAEEAFARHFRAARPDEEALSVSLPELIALLRKRQPEHAHGHRHAGIQPRPSWPQAWNEAHGKGQPLPDRAVGDMSQPTQEETVTM